MNWSPSRTASKLLTISADDEAINTPTRLSVGSGANSKVASWVLSPSSAIKLLKKVGKRFLTHFPSYGLHIHNQLQHVGFCHDPDQFGTFEHGQAANFLFHHDPSGLLH